MGKRIYRHKCKECGTDFHIEDLKLLSIASCPKCKSKGLYIDECEMKSDRYCYDAIDSLKYAMPDWIPPHVEKEKTLLVIELENESSVPKVFYEGEEITGKVKVQFDWKTRECNLNSGGTKFNIDYFETGHKEPVRKGIGLCRGKYALD